MVKGMKYKMTNDIDHDCFQSKSLGDDLDFADLKEVFQSTL